MSIASRGLLFCQGIPGYEPLRRDRRQRLEELQTGDGRPLPQHLKAQVDRELDRLNSRETKIAPRSVRIAVGASGWSVVMFMVSSKNRWQQPFHLARESIATSNTPWDLEKVDVQADPVTLPGKADMAG